MTAVNDAWSLAQAQVLGDKAPVLIYGANIGAKGIQGVVFGGPHVVKRANETLVLLNFCESSSRGISKAKVLVCNEKLFRRLVAFRDSATDLDKRLILIEVHCDDQPLAEPYYTVSDLGLVAYGAAREELEYYQKKSVIDLENIGKTLLSGRY